MNDIEQNYQKYLKKAQEHKATLVAASKKQSLDKIKKWLDERASNETVHLGENYCSELLIKAEALKGYPIKWHFIGSIQSKDLRKISVVADYIHTISRQKELKYLKGYKGRFFIQINISNERSKSGLLSQDLGEFYEDLKANNLHDSCEGLMSIGSSLSQVGLDVVDSEMKQLKEIRDKINEDWKLSLGMSNDYEIALKNDSKYIRVGSAIFGQRT